MGDRLVAMAAPTLLLLLTSEVAAVVPKAEVVEGVENRVDVSQDHLFTDGDG